MWDWSWPIGVSMKDLLWVVRKSLILYTAFQVSSGAPVFQDEGQRLQNDEFSSNGPDSHAGRVSSHYSGAPSKLHPLTALQELIRSRDSTARLSQRESSKLGKSQELQNHMVTGVSHASGHTQDSKVLARLHHLAGVGQATVTSEPLDGVRPLSIVLEDQEPDHMNLNVTSFSVAQTDRLRRVQEAHTTKTTATEDPPDASLLDVTSHKKELYLFEFFERLNSLREKVYELADKIEELKTSGDDLRTSLHELKTDSHSYVPLHNLSEDSSETVMQELMNKNDSKSLGFYFTGWNVTNPDPLLPLIDEVSAHPSAATDDSKSFFRMVSYLRNKQTKGKNGHQATRVLTTTSPGDNKDHFINNPDKGSGVIHKIPNVIDPDLKPVDRLKEFLAKMAFKEKYEDVPVKYYDDQDINQDPKRFLKLSEELRRRQKHVTRNEASSREMPDSGSSVSPSVVLDSAKPTSALPADVESVIVDPAQEPAATDLVHSHPTSTELYDMNPTEKVVVDDVKTTTDKLEIDHHSVLTDKETIDISPSIISFIVESTDAGPFGIENDDKEPVDVDRQVVETVSVESTTSHSMNLTSLITEHAVTSASTEPIIVHPVVTESALEPAPAETVNMMSDTELIVEPASTEPMTMEPSTTEPSSIEPYIKETYVKFAISEPVSMKPTIREPVDLETTTIASVSGDYYSPDSTSMVHVTVEPPVTQSNSPGMTPELVITFPLTHASSEPGATVQETTLATTRDEQTASKIAREGVKKTSLQYHDHTVLLVGLLVTGVSFVMVFIGASILCRVHQKKKELQERVDTEYLRSRYTHHNPLARQ